MNEQRPIIVQSRGPGCGAIALGIVGGFVLLALLPFLLFAGGLAGLAGLDGVGGAIVGAGAAAGNAAQPHPTVAAAPAAAAAKALGPAPELAITDPAPGATVAFPEAVIAGVTEPYAVVHVGGPSGAPIQSDAAGKWGYKADLQPGENTFLFVVTAPDRAEASARITLIRTA
jgi:hypothetical protein